MKDILLVDEVKAVDKRIASCIVESEKDSYYCKIWFKYSHDYKPHIVYNDGRQEFDGDTKEEILENIKEFMNDPTLSFIIK
jgi:hypothetical protein